MAKANLAGLRGAYGNFDVIGGAARRMGEAAGERPPGPSPYGKGPKTPLEKQGGKKEGGVEVYRGKGGKGGKRY